MKDKKEVRDFYNQVGWQQVEEGLFEDAKQFEDLRPISKDYIHKCHLRVNRYLKPTGKYFLDVASGPIQYAEYLTYSRGFDTRICVDISISALEEARKKIGDKGAYILADITNLPFKVSSIDAVLSLHTIYHVPAEEQGTAFREIYRVLKPGSSAVVVYSWGDHSLLMNLALYPSRITQMLRALATRLLNKRNKKIVNESSQAPQPKLYFYVNNYKYFTTQAWGFNFYILVWRSVSVPFTKMYVRNWLLGKQFLSLLYCLEDRIPHMAGRFGQYPLFVVKKQI